VRRSVNARERDRVPTCTAIVLCYRDQLSVSAIATAFGVSGEVIGLLLYLIGSRRPICVPSSRARIWTAVEGNSGSRACSLIRIAGQLNPSRPGRTDPPGRDLRRAAEGIMQFDANQSPPEPAASNKCL
jgi:hypothetical protein